MFRKLKRNTHRILRIHMCSAVNYQELRRVSQV